MRVRVSSRSSRRRGSGYDSNWGIQETLVLLFGGGLGIGILIMLMGGGFSGGLAMDLNRGQGSKPKSPFDNIRIPSETVPTAIGKRVGSNMGTIDAQVSCRGISLI